MLKLSQNMVVDLLDCRCNLFRIAVEFLSQLCLSFSRQAIKSVITNFLNALEAGKWVGLGGALFDHLDARLIRISIEELMQLLDIDEPLVNGVRGSKRARNGSQNCFH